MRERPILFSGAMVRAILDGRKTQTRRIVKSQPPETYDYGDEDDSHTGMILREQPSEFMGKAYWRYGAHWGSQPRLDLPFPTCPYGIPGDRLWVRETLERIPRGHVDYDFARYAAGGEPYSVRLADGTPAPWQWQRRVLPSIHMPRWASRILLEVVSVRVERLQDISEEDARAEGVTPFPHEPEGDRWTDGTHRSAFEYLWGEINGWDGQPGARAPWQSNPWVWVVEFKRVEESQ